MSVPPVVPSNTPITRPGTEIVLFVGPPWVLKSCIKAAPLTSSASGKTTFFRKHFAEQYQHVNQDTLKTRDACMKAATECISRGQSVVIGTSAARSPHSSQLSGHGQSSPQTTPTGIGRPGLIGSVSPRS